MDPISLQRIEKLHPAIRASATAALCECDNALAGRAKLRIASGLRTWKEQNELYAKGRTRPGPKVTNAKAGQSIHNYGLAFDIVLIIDGKTASYDNKKDWDGDRQADWMEVVTIMKKHGFSWGGDWRTFKDLPHFEKTFGYTWQKLKPIYESGQLAGGYVKLPGITSVSGAV